MSEAQVFEKPQEGELFSEMAKDGHELVVFCQDQATGLRGIIAVHNTTLGPAMGGLRMWPYAHEAEALKDALRLSRAMTLKNALAGINVGGGKAVIIGNPRTDKSEALLRRFGRFIHNLNGKYYTAEDVGMSEADMEVIRMETPFVTGVSPLMGGSGDPSPLTAYGTFLGMKAALKVATGSDSLQGKRVMVQGVGHVGAHLVRRLVQEQAQVFIYDLYPDVSAAVALETGAQVVSAEDVYTTPVDIFAPCALGGVLNPDTIPLLQCQLVVGAANNQLLDETRDGAALQARGILYAPDFMVNAGGIINVSLERTGYQRARAIQLTERIYDTTLHVLTVAGAAGITPHAAAVARAEARIRAIGHNRLFT